MFYLRPFLVLYIPSVCGVSIEIDGLIDIGPNWNYEYRMRKPNKSNKSILRQSVDDSDENGHDMIQSKETKIFETGNTDIYENPHTVKDNKKVNEFAFHIYKQSLKVFDSIKQKIDANLSHKVDFIARSYDEKFRNFINETLNQKIKTRLGTQKVILNTIDMSNRLLKRLVNYFIGEINKDGVSKNKMAVANVIQKEVDKEFVLEYKHACKKFGICRRANGFSYFMTDMLTILLKSDDKKLKMASDALTEVLKTTNFTTIMEPSIQKKFQQKVSDIESWDADLTRAVFTILRNIMAMKNHPIKVTVQDEGYINNTVVLLELIDELDNVLAPNEENNLEWTDLKNSLEDWTLNKRHDILEIIQRLISHVMEKGVNKMDARKQDNIKSKFTLLLGQ